MTKEEAKVKTYAIKVPVYTSEPFDRPNDLFGVTHEHMIKWAINKIDLYKKNPTKISRNKRNKVQKKEIDTVSYFRNKIGDVPVLLIKISAYNTNLYDGYVEIGEKITLQHDNKLGSDNNFLLLYPHIIGIDINTFKYQWFILIYEDPNKDNSEIVSTAKLVLDKILNISFANIKLPEVLEELHKIDKIPELVLKFSTISYDDNEVDVKYRTYLTRSRLRKQKEENFKNLPVGSTEEIINDHSYEDEFQKREVRIGVGKKEYKITREQRMDAQDSVSQLVEEIFNYNIAITEQEMKDIYKPEFIISKLTDVITDYLL